MRDADLLATIEAIHAAGLETDRWPQALDAVTQLIGGRGATLEILDKSTFQPRLFLSHGLPLPAQIAYVDQYVALNPRLPSHFGANTSDILYDHCTVDAETMRHSPFYAEFLPRFDCRFFICGIIASSHEEMTAITVQRSPQQGHVQRAGITLMRQILPHVQQAFDVAQRLKRTAETRDTLKRTLDWLADGVALLQADGKVIYANESFQRIARRNDGIQLGEGMIEFTDVAARDKLNATVAAILRLKAGAPDTASVADFPVMRADGAGSYLVSVRPLIDRHGPSRPSQAVAIVLVRDPLGSDAATIGALRELFGFTQAEAALAQALQSGATIADYARERAISLNTVHTHLRRLREKTGCTRMAELIRKLSELRLPLRPN
jgi:DNA-binding CsgD family transcriptional regulator/PAS domain-containing protein